MGELTIPVIQQPRLTLVLPVIVVAGGVVAANLVWFLARFAGAPRGVGGVGAVVCLLGGIALAISTGRGPQGTVRAEPGGELVVDTRFRSERRIQLAGAEVERRVWIRGGPPQLVVGVMVRVSGSGQSITIGAADPGLSEEYWAEGIESSTATPHVMVESADFQRLVERLAARGAPGRGN